MLDDSHNVRLIDLENFGGTEGWAHPDDIKGFIPAKGSVSARKRCYAVYGFGKTVWELYVGGGSNKRGRLKDDTAMGSGISAGLHRGEVQSMIEVVKYMKTIP